MHFGVSSHADRRGDGDDRNSRSSCRVVSVQPLLDLLVSPAEQLAHQDNKTDHNGESGEEEGQDGGNKVLHCLASSPAVNIDIIPGTSCCLLKVGVLDAKPVRHGGVYQENEEVDADNAQESVRADFGKWVENGGGSGDAQHGNHHDRQLDNHAPHEAPEVTKACVFEEDVDVECGETDEEDQNAGYHVDKAY